MLVTCLPGVDRNNLRDQMDRCRMDVGNLRGGGGGQTAYLRLVAYLRWAGDKPRKRWES